MFCTEYCGSIVKILWVVKGYCLLCTNHREVRFILFVADVKAGQKYAIELYRYTVRDRVIYITIDRSVRGP
jgi:hypothetical protein